MLPISYLPPSFTSRNIPQKTITIVHKNGKDFIKDEFIGFHVQRPNFFEVLKDLFDNLFPLQK